MNEVGPLSPKDTQEPCIEAEVEVTTHAKWNDPCEGTGRLDVLRTRRTDEEILMPCMRQTFHQMQNLAGPSIEMAPRFDMKNLHAVTRLKAASAWPGLRSR
jgi:hypothetical protein